MDTATGKGGGEKRIAMVVIHGVGDTDTGWINDYIVDPMGDFRQELKLTPHSELYRLALPGDEQKTAKFSTLVRRAGFGAGSIGFIEMFWADLSRVAGGPVAYIAATLKLLFEGPDVLARAFLRKRWRGEPPRICRRLQLLRDWSHDKRIKVPEVLAGGA